MRTSHLEWLRPLCPLCRSVHGQNHEIQLAHVCREEPDHILEGLLRCPNPSCQREYPVIDGIPYIVQDLRAYLNDNQFQISRRDDLDPMIESVIGDCCGPGTHFDSVRQQISSYAWDHYGEFDPQEDSPLASPGALSRLLLDGLGMVSGDDFGAGPILDIGCGVGRTSFDLAERFQRPVLGIDLNVSMLRLASSILRTGRVRYARRRVGLVYDERSFAAAFKHSRWVDFWACDATALPFHDQSFGSALCYNLLDCVNSPLELLQSIGRVLQDGAPALLASPYDWSSSATAVPAWLGGHSQRGETEGASEPMVRTLLQPGASGYSIETLRLTGENDRPWQVRMHERSVVQYLTHLLAVQRVPREEA